MKIVCQPPPERPATPTRDGSAFGCGAGCRGRAHREIERGEAAGAAQVELVHLVVAEARPLELAHAEPFDVQRDDAALGQIDAADLLVVGGLACAVVAVDVEEDGHFAVELRRLVEQGGNPQAGERLVAQFLDLVALAAVDRLEPLDLALGIAPFGRFAAEDDVLQHVLADLIGIFQPSFRRLPVREQPSAGRRRTRASQKVSTSFCGRAGSRIGLARISVELCDVWHARRRYDGSSNAGPIRRLRNQTSSLWFCRPRKPARQPAFEAGPRRFIGGDDRDAVVNDVVAVPRQLISSEFHCPASRPTCCAAGTTA